MGIGDRIARVFIGGAVLLCAASLPLFLFGQSIDAVGPPPLGTRLTWGFFRLVTFPAFDLVMGAGLSAIPLVVAIYLNACAWVAAALGGVRVFRRMTAGTT